MKRNFIYIFVVFLFVAASGFIVLKFQDKKKKNEARIYELLPRVGAPASYAEWISVKKNAGELLRKIKANENDLLSKLKLAALYLQEARATGSYAYYDVAAMKLVNQVLKKDDKNFDALSFKAMIFLSQHHFSEGLATAEQARKLYPYNAFLYGILTDANVELGRYDSALECADKMISIRPDLRSYSRISYQREIHGDNEGAIEAMKLAVDAGSPGDEATEWSRIQLAKLYEHNGQRDYAKMNYTIALDNRPDYPYALAGLARIAIAENDYTKALELYKKADSIINDLTIKEEMAQTYLLIGNRKIADQLFNNVLEQIMQVSQKNKYGDSTGHYSDKEMAYAYINVNNYDKALEHAIIEYNRRPGNIDANETMAWCYYKKENSPKALEHIKEALKTGSKNPVLLCHAGLIYVKSGEKMTGRSILREALKNNPVMSPSLKAEAEKALQSVQ